MNHVTVCASLVRAEIRPTLLLSSNVQKWYRIIYTRYDRERVVHHIKNIMAISDA
jgi:hypothetical protein